MIPGEIIASARMDIASGSAVRFEPGQEREITLVKYGGDRKAYGPNGTINGKLDNRA